MLVRRSHVTDPHVDGVRETENMSAGVREEVMRLVDSVLASSQVADVPTLLERCLERVRAEQQPDAERKRKREVRRGATLKPVHVALTLDP